MTNDSYSKEEDDDDEVPEKTFPDPTIRQTLEQKRRELEMSLATVKHALNLIGGNDQAEEIYKAVDEALNI